MLQFSTGDFDYNKEDKIFVQESSMLNLSARDWNGLRTKPVEGFVELSNPKTRGSRQFQFTHADLNDGEAMGWNYESKDGIKLLIIND